MNAPIIDPNKLDDSQPIECRIARDGGIEYVTVGDVKKQLRAQGRDALFHSVRDEWRDVDRGGEKIYDHFHFVRDVTDQMAQAGMVSLIEDEVDRLQRKGIVPEQWHVRDNEHFFLILERVGDVMSEAGSRQDPDGSRAARVLDAAPKLFLFQELLKFSGKMIEESFTELWARKTFPVLNLNTWFDNWEFERVVELDSGFPQYMDAELAPSSSGRQSEKRKAVLRKLVFFDRAAAWTFVELARAAEAASANGAPRFALDTKRLARARRSLMHWENVLTFFGDPNVDIRGILSAQALTKIPRNGAAQKLGANGNAEQDRALLVNHVANRILTTEQIHKPNFVGLPTKAWLYTTKEIYGNVSNGGPSETIASMALKSLSAMGVSSFTWVPELGYRQVEATRLQEKGMDQAEAERIAGGINKEDVMLVMKRDPNMGEMIVGKDITMYPNREEVRGTTEVRMLMASGGYEAYQPEAHEIVTDIGPDSIFDSSGGGTFPV